jgi:CRP/FNR family transcriptional regulator, cyclic AMP receptor protein
MDPRSVLKNIYLFRDATPDDLAAVATIAEVKTYMPGDTLYHSGDIPDALYVIEWGTIDITLKDKDIPLGTAGSGQALGEMAFFERAGRLASASVRERTQLILLPFDKLDHVLAERPQLALIFYRHACVFFARQLRAVGPDLTRRYF